MAVLLRLRTWQGVVRTTLDDQTVAETPLSALPDLQTFQHDDDTNTPGLALFRALGGQALLERLDADPDGLLLLDADEAADALPWEFAALPDRKAPLCLDYGFLRLVDRPAPPPPPGEVLHLVALAADPLVDAQGNPRREGRLDFDRELGEVREYVGFYLQ
ncbi:hypothetical protein ARMA_1938 [Ardenticatena maritima]|uniref:Uncharacterized protein n=1 Tax=Ardenticatena maritima TaxID=872965 RepID=A0A0M8K7S8_9CHLR|nr:hypothetical protein [Ardenticatena maritima]KPL89104.1 hypothetical protein SE16_00755 [Ardenticatena maritima]GAP63515.1 hypothetical protein ARMA_1938 [Ardenticatena maritima]